MDAVVTYLQSVDWPSFWLGVIVAAVVGVGGAAIFGAIGESL